MRGTSMTHVGGGENPHLTEPLICEHQGPDRRKEGIDWPEPTPESDAFWAEVSAGMHEPSADNFTRPGRRHSFDHAEAMRRYQAGDTAASIAADLGCTPAAVYNVASKHGIKRTRSRTPEGAKQGAASQARSSAASPSRSGPVNGSHRVPPATEERSPARQQETRPDGAGDRPGKKRAKIRGHRGKLAPHAEEVIRRYQAGESSTAIGADYGVTAGAVTNLLHSRGAKVRDRKQAQRSHYGLTPKRPKPDRPGEKVCNQCSRSRPRSEFEASKNAADGLLGTCRDCRRRPPTLSRAIRNRARHRAYAVLIERHQAEWEQLLSAKTIEVTVELDRIRKAAGSNGDPVPRLKPGPRRKDQSDVIERIDVARCRACHTHHDAKHVCPTCGDDTPENQPLVPPYLIRAWAREQGMAPVPPTGPLPKRIVNAYAAAHEGQVDAS